MRPAASRARASLVAPDDPNRERLDAILSGAARVFGAKGYAATSMREVARETGASLGSIYWHFENKEDLLRALICGNFQRVSESLDARLEGLEDPRAELEAFVENHVEFFARHLDEMRVMSHELDTLRGEAGREVATLRRSYTERARDILERLRPDLADDEIQVATLSLFGMLNWTYRWFHTLPAGTSTRTLARSMALIFLDGLARPGLER